MYCEQAIHGGRLYIFYNAEENEELSAYFGKRFSRNFVDYISEYK